MKIKYVETRFITENVDCPNGKDCKVGSTNCIDCKHYKWKDEKKEIVNCAYEKPKETIFPFDFECNSGFGQGIALWFGDNQCLAARVRTDMCFSYMVIGRTASDKIRCKIGKEVKSNDRKIGYWYYGTNNPDKPFTKERCLLYLGKNIFAHVIWYSMLSGDRSEIVGVDDYPYRHYYEVLPV